MFSVIFEVHPRGSAFDLYLGLAQELRPILQAVDGFIDNERFESTSRPGWILSHSTWRDEKSVVRWRTMEKHHLTQQRGREEVFEDYRLRVGEIVRDSAPPAGLAITEQRLDETEVGAAKYATLTEIEPDPTTSQNEDARRVLDALASEGAALGVFACDVFSSIYNKGKLAALASWRDRAAAERFDPNSITQARFRNRVIQVVRDYGMFDRRESPQYYPDVGRAPRAADGLPSPAAGEELV